MSVSSSHSIVSPGWSRACIAITMPCRHEAAHSSRHNSVDDRARLVSLVASCPFLNKLSNTMSSKPNPVIVPEIPCALYVWSSGSSAATFHSDVRETGMGSDGVAPEGSGETRKKLRGVGGLELADKCRSDLGFSFRCHRSA